MGRFLFTLLATALISEEELRFTHVYKQGYDTSCGVAVTASVLNTYWNIPITESDLYQDLILDHTQEGDINYTVSFLDIIENLKKQGIQSQAYKMDWEILEDTLHKGYAPILIHYEKPDPHFALMLYDEGGYAFVADPAQGFCLVNKHVFMKSYSGNALLTASQTAIKDIEALEEMIARGKNRLKSLQNLARMRRLR